MHAVQKCDRQAVPVFGRDWLILKVFVSELQKRKVLVSNFVACGDGRDLCPNVRTEPQRYRPQQRKKAILFVMFRSCLCFVSHHTSGRSSHGTRRCYASLEEPVINAAIQVINPTQPDESTRVTGEPQNCSEALLLLRLQDYANNLARTQQSLEATCTSLSELNFCQTSVHKISCTRCGV